VFCKSNGVDDTNDCEGLSGKNGCLLTISDFLKQSKIWHVKSFETFKRLFQENFEKKYNNLAIYKKFSTV